MKKQKETVWNNLKQSAFLSPKKIENQKILKSAPLIPAVMLIETFIFAKSGVVISHFKNPQYSGDALDEALVSPFISALTAFSEQTLKSHFKGLVLGDKQLFIVQDQVVIVGVFSLDDTSHAALKTLKKILKQFIKKHNSQLHDNLIIEDNQLFMDMLNKTSKTMFSLKRVLATLTITIIFSLIGGYMFSMLQDQSGARANQAWSSFFRQWLIGILILGIINAVILSDRRWAFFLSILNSFIPSGTVLFVAGKEKLLPAEDTAVLYIVIWLAVAFIINNLFISKIPVASPLALILRKKRMGKNGTQE